MISGGEVFERTPGLINSYYAQMWSVMIGVILFPKDCNKRVSVSHTLYGIISNLPAADRRVFGTR